MKTVWVLNKSTEALVDRFDGQEFAFLPNVPVEIPALVAGHIFGHLKQDRTPTLVRLNWTKTSNDLPDGLKRLDLFEITDHRPNVYRETSPTVDRTPLPVLRQVGGKGTRAA